MRSAVPYREAVHAPDAFAPSLEWTRFATLALALLASAPSVRAVYDLLAYRDCDKQPAPNWALAAFVLLLAIGLGAAGVKLRRISAREIVQRARVRSRIGAVAFGWVAVLPMLLLGLANGVTALFLDFMATFQLCLDRHALASVFESPSGAPQTQLFGK